MSNYNSGWELDALMVPTKAAAIFAANESSLFLGGQIVPNIVVPAGSISAQVPVFNTGTAQTLVEATAVDDFAINNVTAGSTTIDLSLYAARDVLRDIGGVNPAEIGRVLGNAVSASFDAAVTAAMNTATTTQEMGTGADELWDAVATIRGNGETGQLFGVLSPARAAKIMKDIAGAGYAGGDYQTAALMNGFVAKYAGITLFQSANVTGEGVVFGADAMRMATQDGLKLEMQRRAAASGFDVVSTLAAGVALVDDDRAVKLVDLV